MNKKIALFLTFFLLFTSGAGAAGQPIKYQAQPNDTLWGISQKFGIDLPQLMNENPQIQDPSSLKSGDTVNVPHMEDISSEENKVLELVNRERAKQGLQMLTGNSELTRVARKKCQDMINKNYFAHESPTYGSPFQMMEAEGIRFSAAGENIAKGQRSAEEVMSAWMNSPGHRSNIMSPAYTELGVGMAKDKNGSLYWTQLFIKALQ
jgi:uncharacterized YkwD family protein